SHHRRRLRRLGHGGVLGAPAGGWAEGARPRPGNAFELLVDGAEALPRIADEIRRAESHVHIAGWHVDPGFRLEPEGPLLRELLAEVAERVHVRVLVWAGAPLPLFHPSRAEVRELTGVLAAGTRLHI